MEILTGGGENLRKKKPVLAWKKTSAPGGLPFLYGSLSQRGGVIFSRGVTKEPAGRQGKGGGGIDLAKRVSWKKRYHSEVRTGSANDLPQTFLKSKPGVAGGKKQVEYHQEKPPQGRREENIMGAAGLQPVNDKWLEEAEP